MTLRSEEHLLFGGMEQRGWQCDIWPYDRSKLAQRFSKAHFFKACVCVCVCVYIHRHTIYFFFFPPSFNIIFNSEVKIRFGLLQLVFRNKFTITNNKVINTLK